jgi:hypothetical protein
MANQDNGYVPVELLTTKLGQLRRILLSTNDKSVMEQRISKNLGLPSNTFIRFAVKTRSFDTDFPSEEFSKLEADPNEEAIYARAQIDSGSPSKTINNRFLVAIIGVSSDINGRGHDIIEIPLINFNNPVTIIRSLDENSTIR